MPEKKSTSFEVSVIAVFKIPALMSPIWFWLISATVCGRKSWAPLKRL
jgi:hypothetical protein